MNDFVDSLAEIKDIRKVCSTENLTTFARSVLILNWNQYQSHVNKDIQSQLIWETKREPTRRERQEIGNGETFTVSSLPTGDCSETLQGILPKIGKTA